MSNTFHSYNALGLKCNVVPFQQILKEICPTESLSSDVEEELSSIVNDSIQAIVKGSCKLAKHRNASSLEPEDVALFLKTQCGLDPTLISDDYYYVDHSEEGTSGPTTLRKSKRIELKVNRMKKKNIVHDPYILKISKFKEGTISTTENPIEGSEQHGLGDESSSDFSSST